MEKIFRVSATFFIAGTAFPLDLQELIPTGSETNYLHKPCEVDLVMCNDSSHARILHVYQKVNNCKCEKVHKANWGTGLSYSQQQMICQRRIFRATLDPETYEGLLQLLQETEEPAMLLEMKLVEDEVVQAFDQKALERHLMECLENNR